MQGVFIDLFGKKWYNTVMEKQNVKNNQNFKARIDAFFDRNYAYFFAPIIALVAYMVALFSYKVFPFGEDYTAASYDLSAQICPFIEHLFDVLQGKSSLFYSYAIAGGADVTGTFLYFFISPFSFVFLIFGDGKVAYASSIVMALKLASIAVVGTWFAKKLFKNIPDYLCVMVGLVYTYCGYTFVSNTYINWMDFLIYLPLATVAFVRFVKTGRFWLFSALMACCIYTCFSIACFSMFTVFPILIFYGLLCVKKEERKLYLCRLCVSFVGAILLSLPVLLPALSAFLNSARGGGLFDNFWYGFTVSPSGMIGDFNDSSYLDKYSTAMYAKFSYILSDSIFVILTLVWFCRKGFKGRFTQFMFLTGVMTLLPAFIDEAMLLMNMGSYMSYALRFGFLNATYFLGGACLCLDGLCYQSNSAYDGTPLFALGKTPFLGLQPEKMKNDGGMSALNEGMPRRNGKNNPWIWRIVILLVGVAATAFLLWFISGNHYKEIWLDLTSSSGVKDSLKSFSSRFAHSLGGMEVVAVLLGVVLIVSAVGIVLVWRKKIGVRFLSYVLIVVVGVQLLFYNNQLVIGNRSTQHVAIGSYERIAAQLNALETDEDGVLEYFRVKDYGDKMTATAPFTANANSFSVFSSVIDKDNFAIGELFGYKGNYKNTLKSAHNTGKYNLGDEFGDAFLGYKYFLVHKDQKASVDANTTLKKYIKQTAIQDGNFYVYENEIVFPSAYIVAGGEYRFTYTDTSNLPTWRRENQLVLYEYLRGASVDTISVDTVRALSEYLWTRAAEVNVGAGEITANVSGAKAGEHLFLHFVASNGYRVYVNGKEAELVENDLNFLCVELEAGENVVEFKYSSPYVKLMGVGVAGAIVGMLALWFVVEKTRFVEYVSPVIAWAGIALATAVVVFFMLYPTVVWVVKIIRLLL